MNITTAVAKKMHRIKGPSGMLYIEDTGAGGLPVVFSHSFAGSTIQWNRQIEYFSEERNVIAFDFRDHGRSEPPSDKKFAAEDLAGDIEAVVDNLKLDRFVLVGHSMGGSAAVAYAKAHPERVAGLVLAGTPGKSSPEQYQPIIASMESAAYEKVMDQYMEQLLHDSKPEVNAAVMKDFRTMSKESSLAIVKSLFQFDPLPVLKMYNGPVLIITTSREKKQPNALPSQLPDIDHQVIDGTSHWIQMDKPEEFNRILDEFLRKL
jgi:pimeloyl-ACP methyl ester carboxylesterase